MIEALKYIGIVLLSVLGYLKLKELFWTDKLASKKEELNGAKENAIKKETEADIAYESFMDKLRKYRAKQ